MKLDHFLFHNEVITFQVGQVERFEKLRLVDDVMMCFSISTIIKLRAFQQSCIKIAGAGC